MSLGESGRSEWSESGCYKPRKSVVGKRGRSLNSYFFFLIDFWSKTKDSVRIFYVSILSRFRSFCVCQAGQGRDRGVRIFGVLVRKRLFLGNLN